MTKGDIYTKEIITRILEEGCLDKNPRPHYEDGTPAHTLSVNHGMCTYDLTKGESPLITLRPIATKDAVRELLWIYRDASNDLVKYDELKNKNTWDIDHKINNWWEKWALKDEKGEYVLNEEGHPYIGNCYGYTIGKRNQTAKLLEGLIKDPDGRRHKTNLWQIDDFDGPHALKPCAYDTNFNVRHGKDGIDYLDMSLKQRSSDFLTAGCINQVQYLVFLYLVARHCGYTPGRFTWFYDNIQIYDRHIEKAKEILKREPIDCNPEIWLNPEKKDFYDFTPDDIEIKGYPRQLIKEKNPQMTFELGI